MSDEDYEQELLEELLLMSLYFEAMLMVEDAMLNVALEQSDVVTDVSEANTVLKQFML